MTLSRATARAERNDSNEMVRMNEQRADGLKPAVRVMIAMEGYEMEPLGFPAYNQRQDAISAAPDLDGC